MKGELLKVGQTVYTVSSNQPCRVEQFLGGGGQGEVYRASIGGKQFALKWYFSHTATEEQRHALSALIKSGPPGKSPSFLWPLELMVVPGATGYGYLMKLREQRFKGILDLMSGKCDPSFRVLTTAGLQLVECFFQLHGEGLCYRDISFGNAFLDPNTGEVLVCDNDNVAANNSKTGGVLGTPDFMAPEIVRGEASPDRQTDLYSLAVLLFYMYHIHHPLYGKKVVSIKILDLAARTFLCGKQPLFIFDPADNSNEAVEDPEGGANALRYWRLYPQFFRDAFTRSFTTGIKDREYGRVREGEWRQILSRLRDSIYYCFQCAPTGAENFYDADAFKASGGKPFVCGRCQKEVKLPYRIRLNKTVVMLNHDSKLYPHHVVESSPFDFSAPVAEISRNPQNPAMWGLKNLSSQKWVITKPDNSLQEVEPSRSVVLAAGVKINFGTVTGEIRY